MEYMERCSFKFLLNEMKNHVSKTRITSQKSNFFNQVYRIVRSIPKGKVTTYGHIARILCIKDSRIVGWALHSNKDSKVPCHRVVNKNGRLASNFAFGGEKEQKRRLLAEGVKFKVEMYVDLEKFLG